MSHGAELSEAMQGDELKVITHSGVFHCDEVTATALLCLLYDTAPTDAGGRFSLTRTRDAKAIRDAPPGTFVVDVGQVCDPAARRFDHHQRSFAERYAPEYPFEMSSCGLVWRHCGEALLRTRYASGDGVDVPRAAAQAYKYFFAAIDAGDVGTPYLPSPNTPTNFREPLSLPFLVAQLNPAEDRAGDAARDAAFRDAVGAVMRFVDGYLRRLMARESNAAAEAPALRAALRAALARVLQGQGGVMVLDAKPETLTRFLRKHDPQQQVKFIVVPRNAMQWQVWTVRYRHQDFNTYACLDGEEGAGGVAFLHKGRHFAVCDSKEAAVALALRSQEAYLAWSNVPARLWRWARGH